MATVLIPIDLALKLVVGNRIVRLTCGLGGLSFLSTQTGTDPNLVGIVMKPMNKIISVIIILGIQLSFSSRQMVTAGCSEP